MSIFTAIYECGRFVGLLFYWTGVSLYNVVCKGDYNEMHYCIIVWHAICLFPFRHWFVPIADEDDLKSNLKYKRTVHPSNRAKKIETTAGSFTRRQPSIHNA